MKDAVRDRIGLEFLCEIGASPVAFARMAAAAGCRNISVMAWQLDHNPLGYPAWSLLEDRALRRAFRTVLDDLGIVARLGEGLVIRPGDDAAGLQPVIDLFAELGVGRLNAVSFDADRARSGEQFARLAERSRAAGLALSLEFSGRSFGTLDQAAGFVRALRRDTGADVTLLIDLLHVVRAGQCPDDLARIDPDLIGYVQICDGASGIAGSYMDEALNRRLVPGTGQFPLTGFLRVVPARVTVSAEVPQLDLALAGVPAVDRLRALLEATGAMLEGLAERR